MFANKTIKINPQNKKWCQEKNPFFRGQNYNFFETMTLKTCIVATKTLKSTHEAKSGAPNITPLFFGWGG
jgi:hypothetical protein